MKIKILSLFMFIFILLTACGYLQGDALTFRTADPHLSIGVRLLSPSTATATATQVPILPTVTPTPEPPVPTIEPQTFPEMCIVKGNVSASGEKIYHVEGQANYNRVIIDPDHGERCFDTEEEAIEAGWRKALR